MSNRLLAPPSKPAQRISQELPTVKCSGCGIQLQIEQVGDHVCRPAPQPSPTSKTQPGPKRAHSPLAPSPLSTTKPLNFTNATSRPVTSSSPPSTPSHGSTLSLSVQIPRSSPANGQPPQNSVKFPTGPSPATPPAAPSPLQQPVPRNAVSQPVISPLKPQPRSPSLSIHQPPKQSVPGRAPNAGYLPSRSPAPHPPSPLSQSQVAPRPAPQTAPLQPATRPPISQIQIPTQTLGQPSPSSGRMRTPSSASSSSLSIPRNTPLPSSPRPSIDGGRPRPSLDGSSPSEMRLPSPLSEGRGPFSDRPNPQYSDIPGRPSRTLSHSSTTSIIPYSNMDPFNSALGPSFQIYSPTASETPIPDLSSTGNMAGVGRRGFAAAVNAALFAQRVNTSHSDQNGYPFPTSDPYQQPVDVPVRSPSASSTVSRRPNAPGLLEIHPPNFSSGTPPLSPALSSASSRSLHSPLFNPSTPNSQPEIARSRSPSSSSVTSRNDITPKKEGSDLLSSPEKDGSVSAPARLPFFEKFKSSKGASGSSSSGSRHSGERPRRMTESSTDDTETSDNEQSVASSKEETMLAYGRSSTSSFTRTSVRSSQGEEKIVFPSLSASPPLRAQSAPRHPPSRSVSSASSYSSASSTGTRMASKSTGAIGRALETLLEDTEAVGLTSPTGSAFPDVRGVPPRRSHTTPSVSSIRKEKSKNADRICLKCEKKIEDGRWIQSDGGGVLCESCWKNIAGGAGCQLRKARYRAATKPFPDKSFYVFEGKPYCDYHYHEVNNSLCASPTCGQPIEGPCAVSHDGKRYHPEHMVCDWPGCDVGLEEYWEVDGKSLCEKHALKAEDSLLRLSVSSESDDDTLRNEDLKPAGVADEVENTWVPSKRATKRITRFIELSVPIGSPKGGDANKTLSGGERF
ncbi:hypothetical protein SISNIDRAFT_490191 [Sistotremastrum niveocremeum HHB9708]|uniref:LIM zinc-binding domain-containing protein n=1 Tax=Sistotremastrum niveocremeum HHB9708 TaxID=1314777 RepID=A0A164P5V2_9AGAM|nr:hypothetical protein SISNIDRAFT_490191 [Sistotremastrum niveocremeum HHB9708]